MSKNSITEKPLFDKESKREQLLMTILNTLTDGVVCIEQTGKILLFNRAAETIFGYRAEEVMGSNISILMPATFAKLHNHFVKRYEKSGEYNVIGINREINGLRKDGTEFPIEISIGDAIIDGRHVYTGIIKDLTERRQAEEEIDRYRIHLEELVQERTYELTRANKKLMELINVDALTGIANRRYFNEVIESEIRRSIRKQDTVSLLMCDLDYFKDYNDHYGHVAGDECLMKIANCFRETFLRTSDLYARYGGEEFAVILPDTDLETAKNLADKLSCNIQELHIRHLASPISEFVTISIGVAAIKPEKGFNGNMLIKMADHALYNAKAYGRNKVCVSNQSGLSIAVTGEDTIQKCE